MEFKVYILKSVKVEKYYIGSTSNLEKRIEFHKSKRARWTKIYQPWILIHSEEYSTRAEAVKREKYLKSFKGISDKLEKIIKDKNIVL
ncbi:MAG: hypothetical protein A2V93_09890 [Ignavibacteria bacterium RBG_16_34_14]|nr:MAG: hypothetical protein A2V93_09890 [Ignavibacteria bacterium RBG_16_34_14]